MSFKPIRTFLEARLLEVDQDFELHDDAFEIGNIGDNDFDKRYHIFYGNVTTSSANQNTTTDVVTADVTLTFSGQRNATEALDTAMDIANKYRINCLRPAFLRNQTFIKKVVANSIRATPLDTNDNAISIVLSFNITVIFGTGIDLNCM